MSAPTPKQRRAAKQRDAHAWKRHDAKSIFSYHVRRLNGWGVGFGPRPTHCAQCGNALPVMPSGSCTTGYGCGAAEPIAAHRDAPQLKKGDVLERSRAICYPCCGENDTRDMRETGRAVLYLTDEPHAESPSLRVYYASNWPGSLKIRIGGAVRHSRNNFGARRTDVWFSFEGTDWHGVNLGDNQILRCKRLKGTK